MRTSVNRPLTKRKRKNDPIWMYILYIVIYPFYKLWQGLSWLWDHFLVNLFCETKQTPWNGVFGPGGDTYSYHEFSWGKLSFIVALIALILVLIYIF